MQAFAHSSGASAYFIFGTGYFRIYSRRDGKVCRDCVAPDSFCLSSAHAEWQVGPMRASTTAKLLGLKDEIPQWSVTTSSARRGALLKHSSRAMEDVTFTASSTAMGQLSVHGLLRTKCCLTDEPPSRGGCFSALLFSSVGLLPKTSPDPQPLSSLHVLLQVAPAQEPLLVDVVTLQ